MKLGRKEKQQNKHERRETMSNKEVKQTKSKSKQKGDRGARNLGNRATCESVRKNVISLPLSFLFVSEMMYHFIVLKNLLP